MSANDWDGALSAELLDGHQLMAGLRTDVAQAEAALPGITTAHATLGELLIVSCTKEDD